MSFTREEKETIDQLAESISRLCHTVIARRLEQFFEVMREELQRIANQPCTSDDDRIKSWNAVWDQLLRHNRQFAHGPWSGVECALREILRLQALEGSSQKAS